jgi:hypothetical protein
MPVCFNKMLNTKKAIIEIAKRISMPRSLK